MFKNYLINFIKITTITMAALQLFLTNNLNCMAEKIYSPTKILEFDYCIEMLNDLKISIFKDKTAILSFDELDPRFKDLLYIDNIDNIRKRERKAFEHLPRTRGDYTNFYGTNYIPILTLLKFPPYYEYEFNKTDLSSLFYECRCAPILKKRAIFEKYLIEKISLPDRKELVFSSIASGGLLPEYRILIQLIDKDNRKINAIHVVDELYTNAIAYAKQMASTKENRLSCLNKKLSENYKNLQQQDLLPKDFMKIINPYFKHEDTCPQESHLESMLRLVFFIKILSEKQQQPITLFVHSDINGYKNYCKENPKYKADVTTIMDAELDFINFGNYLDKRITAEEIKSIEKIEYHKYITQKSITEPYKISATEVFQKDIKANKSETKNIYIENIFDSAKDDGIIAILEKNIKNQDDVRGIFIFLKK